MAWSNPFSKNKPEPENKNPAPAQPAPRAGTPLPVPKPPAPVREVTVPGMGRVSVRKRIEDSNHPTSIPPQQINVPERFRSTIRRQRPLPTNPVNKGPATVPLRIDLPPAVSRPKPAPKPSPAIKEEDSLLSPTEKEEEVVSLSSSPEAPSQDPEPTTEPENSPVSSAPIFRRRKMNEVAKVVLPPRREVAAVPEEPAAPEPAPSAIIPPSFPVPAPVGGVTRETGRLPDIFRTKTTEPSSGTSAPPPREISLTEVPAGLEPDHSIAEEAPPADIEPEAKPETGATTTPEPKSEEAEKTETPDDRREFLLTNGERVFGRVLSESADEIYLQHDSLGVLTIPQTQVAKRLLEVILINGDRVVGDVVAETTEAIYIRHTSLGVLTIPRSQRSTRVVEAILKEGDRIIGEVLTETDTYTVIRSAALGTVAIQHQQLALLNRKVEQIQPRNLLPES